MACAIQLDFFVFAKVGDYFPCDSDTVKPEYLVWDASMDANRLREVSTTAEFRNGFCRIWRFDK